MSFITDEEMLVLGLKYLGKNVRISSKASVYNPANISIDDNSRIDDFCILSAGSGGITIGKYVHIGCYSSLIGRGSIILEDFSGISGRVSIYSSNDDYSGNHLAHPTVPEKFRKVQAGNVILRKHAIVGTGSVLLPNVDVGVGAVVGALSMVREDCDEFGVYVGCPARKVKTRKRDLLKLEQEMLRSTENG